MIIGVTGKYASGKDSVAEYLVKKGFIHYSLSDEIREEAKKRGLKETRENLIQLGNELREKFGSGVLAERVLLKILMNLFPIGKKINEERNYVLTSIRNPEEVKVLQNNLLQDNFELQDNLDRKQQQENKPHFILMAVTADAKKRFQWLRQRAKEGDPKTFQELVDKEKIEQSSDPGKQQLHKVEKMATKILKNDGTLEELHQKVEKLLDDLKKKFCKPRPSWDTYFMGIMQQVAQRATCDRGKAGCVIVRDKQILCTGYVGSAAGQPHCDDAGHQLKTMVHEDGSSSQHCVRTIHAEQNAICQAAKQGISLQRATVYCRMEPCIVCARLLVNCGVVRVVCEKKYHRAQETRELFRQTKVKLEVVEDVVERYEKQ